MTQAHRKGPPDEPNDEDLSEDTEDTGEDEDISEDQDTSNLDEDIDVDMGEDLGEDVGKDIRSIRGRQDPDAESESTDPDVNREENEGGRPAPREGY